MWERVKAVIMVIEIAILLAMAFFIVKFVVACSDKDVSYTEDGVVLSVEETYKTEQQGYHIHEIYPVLSFKVKSEVDGETYFQTVKHKRLQQLDIKEGDHVTLNFNKSNVFIGFSVSSPH